MSRLLLIGLVVAMMSGFSAADAMAQRDAGAKARGEYGKGFWDPSYRRSGGESSYYRPSRPSTESYRSFSYEPIGINPGDAVVVGGDDVKMMKGANVVGAAPKGLKFKVTKVINGWLGADVEVDGQKLNGWIWHSSVALDEVARATPPQAARDDTQGQSYRRFSYEPEQPSRSYRTYERRREPWQYPKTDPRRYQR